MQPDPQNDLEALLREEPYVRALARVLCAGNEDEIVQQTWLQACSHRGKRVQQPRAWLASIVRNVTKNLLRREGRTKKREQLAAKRGVAPSSFELMQREERRRRLVKLVDTLPPDQREVMVLRYFEGLPPRHIAEQLELPVGTIWNLHRRALERMRHALDAEANQKGETRSAWLMPLLGAPLVPTALPVDAVPTAATALPTGVIAGSFAMTIKTKLAAATAVAAAIALTVFWPETAVPTPAPAGNEASHNPDLATGSRITDNQQASPIVDGKREAAPAMANAAATTGTLRVTAFFVGEERMPASNVTISYRYRADDARTAPRVRTDERGIATFEHLDPGTVYVWGDRVDPIRKVEIVAGETTDHELTFPKTKTIRGIVIDENTQPIANAEIMTSMWGLLGRDPEMLATTDADGRFEIFGAPNPSFVGARAAGYLSSRLQLAMARGDGDLEIKMTLLRGGGTVAGTVVDEQGTPIAQAIVCIGEGPVQGLGGGSIDSSPAMPAFVRTDEDGTFRAISVPPGDNPVWARARDMAPYRSTCVVANYGSSVLRITMQTGGIARGTVSNHEGTAVAKAEVIHGKWQDMERVSTYSDATGAYELRGLPIGEVNLRAEHDQEGKANSIATLQSGKPVTLDLQLSRGVELAGVVTDQFGKPVAKVFVEATAERTGNAKHWMHYARTAEDGSYHIPNCPEGRSVRVEFKHKEITPYRVAAFDPRTGPLNVTVQSGVITAYIRGVVIDENGQPLAGVEVRPRCNPRDMFLTEVTTKADGTFEFGPLPDGKWDISMHHKTYTAPNIATHELAVGESWDLGKVQLRMGGTAIIKPVSVPAQDLTFMITDTQSKARWAIRPAEQPVTPLLRPGDYMLQVWGKRAAAQSLRFTIVSGQQTEIHLPTQAGQRQHFDITYDTESLSTHGATIQVFRGEDKLVDKWLSTKPGEAWGYDVWLLPGTYRVTFAGTLQAETTVTIGASEPAPQKVTLAPRTQGPTRKD